MAVWLFQDCLMEEVKYIIDHSDAKVLVGEGQEEVDKGLAIKDECPKLTKIVWDDPKGMRNYEEDFLGLPGEGPGAGPGAGPRSSPGLFEELIGQGARGRYLPPFLHLGDHRPAQGALLTHWNMLNMGKNLMAVDPCL